MRFLDIKIGALLCFLSGISIAFSFFFIRNIQLGQQLYNHCTRLWSTKSTALSNFMDYSQCFAHFSKGKKLYFPLKFAFSSIQTVHVFTIILFVFAS